MLDLCRSSHTTEVSAPPRLFLTLRFSFVFFMFSAGPSTAAFPPVDGHAFGGLRGTGPQHRRRLLGGQLRGERPGVGRMDDSQGLLACAAVAVLPHALNMYGLYVFPLSEFDGIDMMVSKPWLREGWTINTELLSSLVSILLREY